MQSALLCAPGSWQPLAVAASSSSEGWGALPTSAASSANSPLPESVSPLWLRGEGGDGFSKPLDSFEWGCFSRVICGSAAFEEDCSGWGLDTGSRRQAEPELLSHRVERRGRQMGLPKAPVRSARSKTFGRPCLACWWPTQHSATAFPLGLGMGALEDALGSCAWQGPILTEERRLAKAQGTSNPFGPDLQTVSLGWEGRIHRCIGCGGQRVGRSQECYNWNSLPSAYVFILESLKELWICWVGIRLRWRAQEQSSSLWQAIYYGWLAGLKSECDSSLCLL